MKYKIALIGCGRIGKMHFHNLALIKNIEVKYIIDDYIDQHAYPKNMVKSTQSLDKVLADHEVHAVVIAAPSTIHIELIKKAIQFKKHIFCEKPISLKIQELEEIKNLVEKTNLKLQVGLNRRFDPDFMLLKKYIEQNLIGDIHMINIINRDPKRPNIEFVRDSGGLFFDFNTHDFDMVHYLTKQKVVEAFAMGSALIEPELKKYNDIDTALISLKLEKGTLVTIDTSRETNFGYDQRIEVLGSKGMLKVDNIKQTQNISITATMSQQSELPYWSFIERYQTAYFNEFHSFSACLEHQKKQPLVGIDDMIKAIQVATAVQTSFEKNKKISL